jgi:hypothetical protein
MAGIYLYMQWPLTSQLHGSFSQREQMLFSLRIKLHAIQTPLGKTFLFIFGPMHLFLYLNTQTMHFKSIKHNLVATYVFHKTPIPWRNSNPCLLFDVHNATPPGRQLACKLHTTYILCTYVPELAKPDLHTASCILCKRGRFFYRFQKLNFALTKYNPIEFYLCRYLNFKFVFLFVVSQIFAVL